MKKTTLLLLVFFTARFVFAQSDTIQIKPVYEPGRWSVGLHFGKNYGFDINSKLIHYPSWYGFAEYRFRNRWAVKAGLIYGQYSENSDANLFVNRYKGVAVPVLVKYSFMNPQRRFQAYTQFGLTATAVRIYGTPAFGTSSIDNQYTDLDVTVGLGLRLRVFNRLSLNTEVIVAMPFLSDKHTPVPPFSGGLVYELRN